MLFEKHFLTCYWALVETEWPTKEHQVTIQLDLPIESWADFAHHKVGLAEPQSTVSDGEEVHPGLSVNSTRGHEHAAWAMQPRLWYHAPILMGDPTDGRKGPSWLYRGWVRYTEANHKWMTAMPQAPSEVALIECGERKASPRAVYSVTRFITKEKWSMAGKSWDSWDILNGLAGWAGPWKEKGWKITDACGGHKEWAWMWRALCHMLKPVRAYP